MNDNDKENKHLHRDLILWSLGVIAFLIVIVCITFNCGGKVEPKPTFYKTTDTTTPKIIQNKADIKVLNDSVPIYRAMLQNATNSKNYYKRLHKTTSDSLYDLSDSIGKIRLSILNSIKLKQDSAHEAENQANLLTIVNAFNQIGEYQENVSLLESQHVIDTTKINYLLNDSIPKVKASEFKRGKKVGRKQGFVAGVIVTEGVNVGAKLIP
ncbi:MAG: hypothetical protein V4538_15655 [Bacteroidota bacterium]